MSNVHPLKINPHTETDNNALAKQLVEKFNEVLREEHAFHGLHGTLVCDIFKKKFPEYRFDTRKQGWEWFFIEDHWIRFYFGKDVFRNDIIIRYDFYKPFHNA